VAEARGWAWTYWQFDSDFIVYDIDKDRCMASLLEALIPRRLVSVLKGFRRKPSRAGADAAGAGFYFT